MVLSCLDVWNLCVHASRMVHVSVLDVCGPWKAVRDDENMKSPPAARIQIAKTNFPLVVAAVFSTLEMQKVSDQHKPLAWWQKTRLLGCFTKASARN